MLLLCTLKTLDLHLGNIASPMIIPKTHRATGIILHAFKHSWEPIVKIGAVYEKNTLPPPFEAFGDETLWNLHACEIKHAGECFDFTVSEAKHAHEKNGRLLKQFNVLFGVTRNKKFAAELRALKKQEKEEEEKEEESEESETESESESEEEEESESEEGEVSDSESDEDSDSDSESEEEPKK